MASYNYEGETKRLYCTEHNKAEMIIVNCKKCMFDGCKKQPSINMKGRQYVCIVMNIKKKE